MLGDFNIHDEAPGVGAAQRFMVAMTTMGMSQKTLSQTHKAGLMLDLVFTAGQEISDLDVEEIKLTPLSWTDHFLIR